MRNSEVAAMNVAYVQTMLYLHNVVFIVKRFIADDRMR